MGNKADPCASAPEGIQPEWYFLFMFQALKELPSHVFGIEGDTLGVLFFAFCGLAALLVPFLDRGKWSCCLCCTFGLCRCHRRASADLDCARPASLGEPELSGSCSAPCPGHDRYPPTEQKPPALRRGHLHEFALPDVINVVRMVQCAKDSYKARRANTS